MPTTSASTAKYRDRLPQLQDRLFMTDGGLETTLIVHERLDLPAFAAFDQLKDDAGCTLLRSYFQRYAAIARAHGMGIVLESSDLTRKSRLGREARV